MLHFRNWLCSSVEQKQTNGCPSNLNWHAFNIRDSGSCNSTMPGGPQIPQSSLIMWYLNLFCLLFIFWKLIVEVEVACHSSTFILLPSFSKECFRVETFKLYNEKADFSEPNSHFQNSSTYFGIFVHFVWDWGSTSTSYSLLPLHRKHAGKGSRTFQS